MHRRHQSSGAALISPTPAAAAAAAAASAGSSIHMTHAHSMPSVQEAAAAAAAAAAANSKISHHSHSSTGVSSFGTAGAAAAGGGNGSIVTAAASVFQVGSRDLVLQPGAAVVVPLWLHVPRQPGRFDFQCVWFCEPQVSHQVLGVLQATGESGLRQLRSFRHSYFCTSFLWCLEPGDVAVVS